ncbi:recombinase family protein [Streptomyces mirabilis]|uniref:recombinase family protein n=1 Tax=Streptomyces mirabilis TaxID=68239 RepID=UPI0036967A23
MSRLARSSAEFGRLLEFARLTDILLIDGDGVYDLSDFNDRLVLGLRSTMSEAELHILAGRLHGARRAVAKRGDLRLPLPVGLVHDAEGRIVIDPDEEVRAAVADIFTLFACTRTSVSAPPWPRRSGVPASCSTTRCAPVRTPGKRVRRSRRPVSCPRA